MTKIDRNYSSASMYAQGIFLAVATILLPGLGHLLIQRYLRGAIFLLGTCLGYVLFIVPGVAVHVFCVANILMISFDGRHRLAVSEAALIDLKEIRRNSSRASVYVHGALLALASGLLPGLGHLLTKRYRAGAILLVGTCAGYVLFIVPGLLLHIGAAISIMFMTFLERRRLESVVDMCELMGIEIPPVPHAWLGAMNRDQFAALRLHLKAHRAWPSEHESPVGFSSTEVDARLSS